jgi:AcrR family transcriptional regulator
MRLDAERNRTHLLATARAMAEETGGGEPPALNELARRAGVGVATVYRHFADADALAITLMEEPLRALGALLDRAVAEEDAAEALRALFHEVLALEMEHPMVARLVHAPPPVVADHLAKLQTAAGALVRRAKRAHVLRAGVSADDVCHLLLGIHAAAHAAPDPRAAARKYADILLAGLLVSGATGTRR